MTGACKARHVCNRVHGSVKRRSHQIVHRSIHNYESLPLAPLYVTNVRQQHTRGRNDISSRLQQQMNPQRLHEARNKTAVFFTRRHLLVGVPHAEPASKIQITQLDSFTSQLRNVSDNSSEGLAKRLQIRNLGTNVRADAIPGNLLCTGVFLVKRKCCAPLQAELVFVTPSRNM